MKNSIRIYIISSPHSGSTLLSHVLGKHPQALNLGEVSFLPKLLALEEPCSCGEAISRCEFWCQVLGELAKRTGKDLRLNPYAAYLGDAPKGKLGSGLIDHKYQTPFRYGLMKARGALDTVSVLYAPPSIGLKALSLPLFTKAATNTIELYEAACRYTGKDVIIDASKMPRKAAHLYAAAPEQVYVIHLVRDGRGVVASRKKYMPVKDAARRWSHYQKLSRRLLQRWVPEKNRIRLLYEDFVSDPEASLRSAFRWIGLSYDSECLKFRPGSISHSAGGNPARFEMSQGIRAADNRWRTELSQEDLATFEKYAGQQNRWFGYE